MDFTWEKTLENNVEYCKNLIYSEENVFHNCNHLLLKMSITGILL